MNHTETEKATRSSDELLAALRSTDETVSSSAYDKAAEYGADAVLPLASVLTGTDAELARKAKRALYRLVRYAGRPGARAEVEAIEVRLLEALARPELASARRDLLWLLSEVGTTRAVEPVERLLYNRDLREDARCVLVRIPHRQAVSALKKALTKTQDDEFRYALADGLRAKGVQVKGYPTRKMVPTASTTVAGLPRKQ